MGKENDWNKKKKVSAKRRNYEWIIFPHHSTKRTEQFDNKNKNCKERKNEVQEECFLTLKKDITYIRVCNILFIGSFEGPFRPLSLRPLSNLLRGLSFETICCEQGTRDDTTAFCLTKKKRRKKEKGQKSFWDEEEDT